MVRIPVRPLAQAVRANRCFQALPAAPAFQGVQGVQEHPGDPAGPAARSCPSKVPEHPACQRRRGPLEKGRSTPLARPSLPEVPFHLESLWLLEVLAAHQGPEAQRHWHQGAPSARQLLSALETPWHLSLRWGQVVPEVPEAPECQANPGLQVPPAAPGFPFPGVQALPGCPSVLGALELQVDRAGPVSQAGPHLLGPALLWGRASQAVLPCSAPPPAGWGRQCSHHPFLLSGPWGPARQVLPTVPAAPWCLALQDLQGSQHHPCSPSVHALQPCPVSLASQSPGAQALPSLQEGQARPPRSCPHPEARTGLGMAHKAPPSPL